MQNVVQISKKYSHLTILNRYLNKNKQYFKQTRSVVDLLECDGKKVLRGYGVNVQDFIIIEEKDDIKTKLDGINFTADTYVIKAQIFAGGRFLGVFDNGFKRGVHFVKERDKIENIIRSMLGHNLITKQTKKTGAYVKKVMIAKHVNIQRESYISLSLNSVYNDPIIMAALTGGTSIEDAVGKNKDAMKIFPVDLTKGITEQQSRDITDYLEFKDELRKEAANQLTSIWNAFVATDATLIEINPFCLTTDNKIVAVDAKTQFDTSALFRQKEIRELQENTKEYDDEREIEASKFNIRLFGLNGDIGCIVNGAIFTMATIDAIHHYGGKPATMLDIKLLADENQVFQAMKILLHDTKIKSILVNVIADFFMCTLISEGIIHAMNEIEVNIPVTVRLEGNKFDEAIKMLSESDHSSKLNLTCDLHSAVQLAVQ